MAKANKFAHDYGSTHVSHGEHKIPLKYRKDFMGNNKDKWVDKKKYDSFLIWKKRRLHNG